MVGEHAVDPAQRVVPGGAGALPVGGQPLVAGEDLLHHRVGPAGGRRQPLQVAARVGEPVRVVDPEAVQHALAVQPQQHAVGGLEHLGTLDPDGDQLVDGEEPPVVQLGAGQSPPGRAVPLPGEQLGQRQRLGAGAQRQHVVVVAEGVAVDGQLVEDGAEPVAEQGQQHPAASGGVHRARLGGPVDVEPVRVRRVGAVPEHLPERTVEVLGDGDRHVVGHHVGDQPQVVPVRLGGQLPECLLAAELLGYPAVVDGVVAVGGAGRGGQQRGEVQVGDAEGGQVGDGGGGVVQGEAGLELEAVAGRRHGGGGGGRAGLRGLGGVGHASMPTRRGAGARPVAGPNR